MDEVDEDEDIFNIQKKCLHFLPFFLSVVA